MDFYPGAISMKVVANFKENSFYQQVRRKYFTMVDWFSFVGGILGLFFGFSFLSAFEVIFHIWKGLVGLRTCNCHEKLLKFINESKFAALRKYVKSFLSSSSIHGFNYLSSQELTIADK
jgi:hypothetical protein